MITVFVSGLFALAVAFVTSRLANSRDSGNFARELARQRSDAVRTVYANYLAYLEKCMRWTERRADYSELDDLVVVSAQVLLSGSPAVIEQTEYCGNLLYQWSTEYRRGAPKQIGDTGLSMIAGGDSEHTQKARELRPKLDSEVTKLLNLMKSHLKEIEP